MRFIFFKKLFYQTTFRTFVTNRFTLKSGAHLIKHSWHSCTKLQESSCRYTEINEASEENKDNYRQLQFKTVELKSVHNIIYESSLSTSEPSFSQKHIRIHVPQPHYCHKYNLILWKHCIRIKMFPQRIRKKEKPGDYQGTAWCFCLLLVRGDVIGDISKVGCQRVCM